VGRTGDKEGIVGTVELGVCVGVGDAEDDTAWMEGKVISGGVKDDDGTPAGITLGPVCRR